MPAYKDKKYRYQIDLPEEWSPCKRALPLLPSIIFWIANGWFPKPEVEFSTGPHEYLNMSIEKMMPEPTLRYLESSFERYAEQEGYSHCMIGRFSLGGKEHVWARYRMPRDIWSKKYMIIFNGVGYAITASCAGMELAIRRENIWDQIAGSFRLLRPDE